MEADGAVSRASDGYLGEVMTDETGAMYDTASRMSASARAKGKNPPGYQKPPQSSSNLAETNFTMNL